MSARNSDKEKRLQERVKSGGNAHVSLDDNGWVPARIENISTLGLQLYTDLPAGSGDNVIVNIYIKERDGDDIHPLTLFTSVAHFELSNQNLHGKYRLGLRILSSEGEKKHYDDCCEDLLELKGTGIDTKVATRIQ